jgi:hypothetical protein
VRSPAAAVVVLALLAAACGGSDDEQGAGCLQRWNDTAPANLRSLMAIANDANADVLVGEYRGDEFSAEALDTTTTGTGTRVAVTAGSCVATQTSGGRTLFAFVLPATGEGAGGWHRISEAGDNPLVRRPEGAVSEPARARVARGGRESRLEER